MTTARTPAGLDIETAPGEVLAHARGETELRCRSITGDDASLRGRRQVIEALVRHVDASAPGHLRLQPRQELAPRRAVLGEVGAHGAAATDPHCLKSRRVRRPDTHGRSGSLRTGA